MGPFNLLGLDAVASSPFLLFLHLLQVALFIVLIRHFDVYEREPFPIVLAMFVWGGLGATVLSLFGNGLVGAMLDPETDALYGAAITAPLVEETSKGIALVAVFYVAYRWARRRRSTSEFGGVTDGVVYGAAVGFGFAFVENIFYFVMTSTAGGFDFGVQVLLDRVDFVGLGSFGHGLYTACLGAGLGYAMWCRGRGRKVLAVGAGLAAGMLLHASWNGLAVWLLVRQYGTDVVLAYVTEQPLPAGLVAAMNTDVSRYFVYTQVLFYLALLAMAALFVMWLRYEGKIIAYELAEETNRGLISAEEYELLPSVRARYRDYYQRLRRGEVISELRHLHDRLTDLAMMKWRHRLFGGGRDRVDRARAEITLLRTYQTELAHIESPAAKLAAPTAATEAAQTDPRHAATPPPAAPPPTPA